MQPDLCQSLARRVVLEDKPAVSVVMAYEDIPDGQRAMKTYNGLVNVLGRDCEFHYELWKFEALQVPELRTVAAGQARDADMVIIATHSPNLPRSLKSWIAAWSAGAGARPGRPCALVALLAACGEWHPGSVPVFTDLADAAAVAGLEFFSHFDEAPAPTAPAQAFSRLRERAETTSTVLEQILKRSRPTPHGGINE